ncbi:MAG: hypothetical protein ACWA5T_02070 [Parvularcula sp.]
MFFEEALNERADFPGGTGIQVITQRDKAIPLLGLDPDHQLAVFLVLFFGLPIIWHQLGPFFAGYAMYIHCISQIDGRRNTCAKQDLGARVASKAALDI